MAVRVTIIDKMPDFIQKLYQAMDRSLNRMAIDIERLSKQQVPVLHGQLRASGKHQKVGFLQYSVSYEKEYAWYQHEGTRPDGSHVVKRHTKPGTKTLYLKDPGDIITAKAKDYFAQEASKIRV